MKIDLGENDFEFLKKFSKNRFLKFSALFSADARRARSLLDGLQSETKKEDRRKFTSAENGKKGGRPRKKPIDTSEFVTITGAEFTELQQAAGKTGAVLRKVEGRSNEPELFVAEQG